MKLRARMSPRQLFAISAYWLATNQLWAALMMVIIPSQIKLVAPRAPAETLGWLLGLGAIPAIIVPLVVGPLSDRCTSRWGRRRPYMVHGVAVNLVGLLVLWAASRWLSLSLYAAGYLVANIGNNVATAAYSGVIPDIVPEEQRGEASGWMAAMSLVGMIVGVLSAGWLLYAKQASIAFIVIAVCLVVFLLITTAGVRERPREAAPEPLDWVQFLKSLWIDPRRYPDFAWVWITRALVVMGIYSVQEYLQLYLTDVLGVKEGDKEIIGALMIVTGLLLATVSGVFGGKVSDRIGRKRVVYIANTIIALACLAFPFSRSLTYAIAVFGVFGLGYGAYYSVDWALACDVLPSQESAAKDMAVWHIAMTLPQSIALPISGMLLGMFGKRLVITAAGEKVAHYYPPGYTALFSMAALFLLLGAVLLRNVKKAQ
jgi:MFS family permease